MLNPQLVIFKIFFLQRPTEKAYELSKVMASAGKSVHSDTGQAGSFATTHWSVVMAAGQWGTPQAEAALEALCQTYWFPLYAFIRHQGFDRHEAKDLTQEFFARLVGKHYLHVVDRQKGRFRSFLLSCVQHFLCNEFKKEQAVKRGGQCTFVSLDEALAEQWYGMEMADPMTPERLYERSWAMALLDHVMTQLKQDYERAGKASLFTALHRSLTSPKGAAASYATVARQLQMSEAAVRQAAYRLRGRFGELLRLEVAQTVAHPGEIEAELVHLQEVLAD